MGEMTDKEVFTKFMSWMNMEVESFQIANDREIFIYKDPKVESELFTKWGYDEFFAGAIFDKDGKLVKGYLDSHVQYSSENADFISSQINSKGKD